MRSDGVGVGFGDAFFGANSVGPPVDVEEEEAESDDVLVGGLVFPGLVFLGPSDVAIVSEFRLISLLEILLEELLFGLDGEILVVSPPVVEVVIAVADVSQQRTRSSQHIYQYYYPIQGVTSIINSSQLQMKVGQCIEKGLLDIDVGQVLICNIQMEVRCAHILQKHKGSRRPFDSYRNVPVTRTIEEARANIQGFLKQVREDPKLFKDIATKYSECSSCQKGGDLGFFGKGDMQKAFEDASFNLKVGEISNVVETDSGVHIILRIA